MYLGELAKFGRHDMKNEEILTRSKDVIARAQCTALECQLLRCCFKKDENEANKGATRYMCSYAHVPESSVAPQIWKKAQALLSS